MDDLSGAIHSGDATVLPTVGETWTEIKPASWTRLVTVIGDGPIFLAVQSMGGGTETPADTGEVGDHKIAVEANIKGELTVSGRSNLRRNSSIFVAAQGGTVSVTVIQEA